ncbi:hypothetical protein ABPG74_002869 [Tetrahymena malaccensis]
MKSHSKKYQVTNNLDVDDNELYPQSQILNYKNDQQNQLNNQDENNPDLIETEDINFNPNNSTRLAKNSYKIQTINLDNNQNENTQKQTSSQTKMGNNNNSSQNSILETTYQQDKFINGAIIAIRSQNLAVKYIVDHIKEITDRNLSEAYVRKIWDHWLKYKDIYFSSTLKTRLYTKHEAIQLYDAIFKQYNPTNQTESIIPKIKEVLQKHAVTKKLFISYSQFEEVKGLDTEETYLSIKEAIDSGQQSAEPKWIDVSVRMMISASQFEYKKQIEIQCFNKLKSYLQFTCIQLIGVVMGETLNGRGKFIYIHCKYDLQIIKRNKYLKRFLLEVIPDWFYSYNCVHSQKIAIFKYSKFLYLQRKILEEQERKRFIPNPANSQLNQSTRFSNSNALNNSLNLSYQSSAVPNANNQLLNNIF